MSPIKLTSDEKKIYKLIDVISTFETSSTTSASVPFSSSTAENLLTEFPSTSTTPFTTTSTTPSTTPSTAPSIAPSTTESISSPANFLSSTASIVSGSLTSISFVACLIAFILVKTGFITSAQLTLFIRMVIRIIIRCNQQNPFEDFDDLTQTILDDVVEIIGGQRHIQSDFSSELTLEENFQSFQPLFESTFDTESTHEPQTSSSSSPIITADLSSSLTSSSSTTEPQSHEPLSHEQQPHEPQPHEPQSHEPQSHEPQHHEPLPSSSPASAAILTVTESIVSERRRTARVINSGSLNIKQLEKKAWNKT